jgi:hypothetical protein
MAKSKPRKLALDVETLRSLEMAEVLGGARPRPKPQCPTTQSLISCSQVI